MKLSPLKASLVALALVSALGVAEAQAQQSDGLPAVSQQDATQQLDAIRQFLAGGKELGKMKLPRLQQRLHRAQSFRDLPNLPPELDQALEQEIARIAMEISGREQADAEQPQPQTETPPPEPQTETPPPEPQTETPPPPEPQTETPPPPEPQIEDPPLPPYDPQKAGEQQGQSQPQPETPPPQPPVAEQPAAQPPPPVAEQPTPAPTEKQIANPTVNPALEKRAQAYLADTADVQSMKRKQLRKRLSAIRDLLATNQLSPQTREAVRQKLARERAVLRSDVAADEDLPPTEPAPAPQKPAPQPGADGGSTAGTSNVTINNTTINNTEVQVVLQDRRPPRELDDRELVRRIDVYREVVADDRYDAAQRMLWRRQMEEDRRFLRGQMMAERARREALLRQGDAPFDYEVRDRWQPGYDVPDDVFAAEVDDDELADVLVAPPRRQIERRYTVDDVERSPQLRQAMARIEIDTVHFGFGEGFLREEEIDKLDRIASVLERILARYPDEVFLIEGHTDAVGSDRANLALSRQRAAAVKEALTTYYVIPAGNLETVGLGERYLKIPTSQPEAENRRVSLARITPLVGQAAD